MAWKPSDNQSEWELADDDIISRIIKYAFIGIATALVIGAIAFAGIRLNSSGEPESGDNAPTTNDINATVDAKVNKKIQAAMAEIKTAAILFTNANEAQNRNMR